MEGHGHRTALSSRHHRRPRRADHLRRRARRVAWDNGQLFRTWRAAKGGKGADFETPAREQTYTPTGESATVGTIRDIIRELETGERTSGNIDVTMQTVEAQFGIVESHLRGGARVSLPIADRSVYIPGR